MTAEPTLNHRGPLGVVDRIRTRLLDEGWDASMSNVVLALRRENVVVDEEGLLSLVEDVQRELTGAGPLEDFFAEPNITDVMVVGGRVWVDRGDGLQDCGPRFRDEDHVRGVALRLAARAGRRLDEASPFVDARLANGARLHCVIPPIATDGTCVSVRLPRHNGLNFEQLVQMGTLDRDSATRIRQLIDQRRSFLVTGGTGSGKTTVLGALLGLVANVERIVIIEDTAELEPIHPHVVRLQSRPANVEGAGQVTLRDLLRQSLRMRPDRIVVGEVRGPEIVDLLTALNTGHEGGAGTLHANAPHDVPARVEALALMAGVPRAAVHALLASAVDCVVHLERLPGGQRVVSGVHSLDLRDGLVRPSCQYQRNQGAS